MILAIRSRIVIVVTELIAIFVWSIQVVIPGANPIRIVVLASYKKNPFEATLKGFQEFLSQKGIQADYTVYFLGGDAAKAAQAVQEAKEIKANVIFTLGSLATEAAIRGIDDIPIISGMVLRGDRLKEAGNATGVFLEVPLDVQFQWLQRFLPKVKSIGVIYNPEENQEKIERAAGIVQKMGMKLEAKEVHAPQDLPAALEYMANRADVLWGVADKLVLTSQTARQILLFSFRNRIPFVGLSSSWVKAGALYALHWDYADIGKQCGEMAFKVFQNTRIDAIPPVPSQKVLYCLNLKTAQRMKVNISEDLIRDAHHVF